MSQEHEHEFRRHSRAWVAAGAGLVLAGLVLVASGCKSGASFSKPSSWWAFGGSGDPAQLASAPPFDESAPREDGVTKPSSMASPYPTTTTPQGYVMNEPAAAPSANAATAQASAGQLPNYPSTEDAAPITYGQSTPAPMTYPDTAEMAGAGAVGAAATQNGPYATLPSAAQPPATMTATPDTLVAPARVADSRVGSSFGDSVAPAAASTPSVSPESRYGDVNASRFGGSGFGAGAAVTAPPMAPAMEPPLSSNPAAVAAPAPSGPMSSSLQSAPLPVSPDSLPGSPSLPATPSGSSLPATPPRRRPDPGYRPGGTSSYRPSSSILVGEPTAESAVRAASFDTPAEPVVR
jgi:hypothetical protein